MKLSALIAPLIAAKVPHELILEQILAFESEQDNALELRRATDAARQARKREREKSRDVTVRPRDRSLTGDRDVHVEDNSLTQKIEPLVLKVTPRSELEAVLDVERASAVIEHRQRLRKPLTARAAKMLAGELRQFPDPNAAADRMILKGWQSIEAGWKPQARGSPAKRENLSDAIDRKFNGHDNPNDTQPSQAVVLHVPAPAFGGR